MNLSVLGYEVADRVARIAIHNPPVNALDTRFLEDFEAVLDRLSQPGEARSVVVRSDCPGFFSAGDDVRELREIRPETLAALPGPSPMHLSQPPGQSGQGCCQAS